MEDWRKWVNVDTTWEKFHRIAVGGMQAEVGGTLYVIGDINCLGGVCDCCSEVRGLEKVSRYRWLVDPEEAGLDTMQCPTCRGLGFGSDKAAPLQPNPERYGPRFVYPVKDCPRCDGKGTVPRSLEYI